MSKHEIDVTNVVSSHNEWDQLEEIIVGIVNFANRPVVGRDQKLIEYFGLNYKEYPTGPFDKRILEEAREDLEHLVETLEGLGVTVKRPSPLDHRKTFCTPDWCSNGFYSYAPRDPFLVIGDTIIETPMALRARYFEPFAYKDLFVDYFRRGATWIAAPKPRLLDELYNDVDDEYKVLGELEPIFDGANVLRAGRDLFYLVSTTGNVLGYKWLQRTLGPKYRVHPLYGLYSSIHLDSTIAFVRPGLVILNASRVTSKNLPPVLKKWDKIWFSEPVDIGYSGPHPYSSVWIAMNILMINPSLAIVDKNQKEIIRALERYHIDVIPLELRHARTLGGGFHCVTLDIRRKGQLEDYFN